jgi:hypothetical protein
MKNEMEDLWKGTFSTPALRTLAKLTFDEEAPKRQGELIQWLIEKKAAPKTWKEYMLLVKDELVPLTIFFSCCFYRCLAYCIDCWMVG